MGSRGCLCEGRAVLCALGREETAGLVLGLLCFDGFQEPGDLFHGERRPFSHTLKRSVDLIGGCSGFVYSACHRFEFVLVPRLLVECRDGLAAAEVVGCVAPCGQACG